MSHRFLLLGLLIPIAACAPTGSRGPGEAPVPRRVLAGSDLQHPHATNALDLIRMQRPQFLLARGPAGTDRPILYIDEIRTDDVYALASVPKELVAEIRYLTPLDAHFKLGPGHPAGAVLVTLIHAGARR